jgi:hypothetical protein
MMSYRVSWVNRPPQKLTKNQKKPLLDISVLPAVWAVEQGDEVIMRLFPETGQVDVDAKDKNCSISRTIRSSELNV